MYLLCVHYALSIYPVTQLWTPETWPRAHRSKGSVFSLVPVWTSVGWDIDLLGGLGPEQGQTLEGKDGKAGSQAPIISNRICLEGLRPLFLLRGSTPHWSHHSKAERGGAGMAKSTWCQEGLLVCRNSYPASFSETTCLPMWLS